MILRKLVVALALAIPFVGAGAVQPAQALSQCSTYSNGASSKWTRCDSYAGSWQYIATEVQCSTNPTVWVRGNRIWLTSQNSVVYCPSGTVIHWHLAIWYW